MKFTREDDSKLIEITKINALITLTAVKVEKMQNDNEPFNQV
ncbi:hypothetical protein [Nonlabens ulvanivorans]|nr:hypothetical protein [Nonlabens ulvanivorans]